MDDARARVEGLLDQLTIDEQASIVAGRDLWNVPGIERIGFPGLRVTDGPNGARGPRWTGQGAACFPSGVTLGNTWDPDLVERVGVALGEEARTKGAHVLLAPTVNLHRHPLAGRNFECYSEDPLLSARLAVGFVRGVQSVGVATTVKHFVANDSEFERMTISSEVDEVTLRELYLVPFEAAVREAGAWGIMTAYNRLNGVFCSEHPWTLGAVLRDEWGFDGLVISDWFGTHSTAAAADAGLDLEMPGPPQHFGPRLADAVRTGAVTESTLRRMAGAVLQVAARTGALDGVGNGPAEAVDRPEHRALAREVASMGFVLLRNEGPLLPLDTTRIERIALVGPGADAAWIMGGGSASLTPHYSVTPLEGLRAALGGTRTEVTFARGPAAHRALPVIDGRRLVDGFGQIEYHATTDLSGPVVTTEACSSLRQTWMGHWTDELDPSSYSARVRAELLVEETGTWTIALTTVGPARLWLDGAVAIDAWDHRPAGDSFFGFGSRQMTAPVELVAGQPTPIELEYTSAGTAVLGGFLVGIAPPEPADALATALSAARAADVAVVVVGTGPDWETEGRDRESMELPRDQDALVRAVAAANPRTVVCLNAAAPVTTDWIDDVAAVLHCGLPGQEWGNALADVLLGAIEPGGRLATTFPKHLEDAPSHPSYPGHDGQVHYEEGLLMGYRHYDTRQVDPRFAFGHGLGYTTFAYGPAAYDAGIVRVDVTNTGARPGHEVVQCYVHRLDPAGGDVERPDQELRAFAKVGLEPGETRTVELTLPDRAFQVWDQGWREVPGAYEVRIGASSRDCRVRLPITR